MSIRNKFRLTWQRILVLIGALTVFFSLGIGLWLWSLNNEITDKLQNKRFMPPTEFYTAPFSILNGSKWSLNEVLELLNQKQYRSVPQEQPLAKGQFWQLSKTECATRLGISDLSENATCIIYSTKTTPDPVFSESKFNLQAMLWNDNPEIIYSTLQGNPLQKSDDVWFEPELFAQYIGQSPVLQSWKDLGQTPLNCLNSVLAIEDSHFLEHNGVSFLGIFRAAVKNLLKGKVSQGGSTITQQMVKNFFLTPERTISRKIKEIAMSLLLELHSNKDQIFETYLNIIYMGQSGPFEVRGFGAAAQHYFKKDLAQLELHECSLLAALLNSPGGFDPDRHPEKALARRGRVLERLQELNMISSSELKQATSEPLPKTKKQNLWETAPYYIQVVLKELADKGISSEGLQIFTGLNIPQQVAAQKAVQDQLLKLESENTKIKKIAEKGFSLEGIFMSLDIKNNWVTSAVGGRSFRKTQYNRILEGHRQIGSLMKPIVYYSALEKNPEINPLTMVTDAKETYTFDRQKWSPENYGKKYEGEIPLYFGLKKSLNAATVKIGMQTGLDNIKSNAEAAGVTSELKTLPSLILGAFELYPYEVLQIYSTIAHFGVKQKPVWLRSARVQNGAVMLQDIPAPQSVWNAEATAELVSMMKQTILSGTAQSIFANGFTAPAAGKTGTTSDSRDTWFAGFTPYRLAISWVGYDQSQEKQNLTGASAPVPIWLQFMKQISFKDPADDFHWPENTRIETVKPEKEIQEIQLVFKK